MKADLSMFEDEDQNSITAGKKLAVSGPESLRFDDFTTRHIGPDKTQVSEMLASLGLRSLDELVQKTVPSAIQLKRELNLPDGLSEFELLNYARQIASKNQVFKTYLGIGFHDCIVPPVVQRNILENPGWYTQYTPYQPEISQGRLEALVNFQTMICDLTGMQIANASLLDEGSAAAEGMGLAYRLKFSETKNKFFVDSRCHPPTIEVVRTRAIPLGIEVVLGDFSKAQLSAEYFGALIQYPTTCGEVVDYSAYCESVHKQDALVIAAADILALTVLTPPGEWGADICVGNSQRFGVPMGFGGPHAAFMATHQEHARHLPGRLVGVSKDSNGKPAYRLTLQTREQHIKRDRATSNICTAQVLLAVIASMFAVYHGPKGLRRIGERVYKLTRLLQSVLAEGGFKPTYTAVFDTLKVSITGGSAAELIKKAHSKQINLRLLADGAVGISLNETTTLEDVAAIASVFGIAGVTAEKLQKLFDAQEKTYRVEAKFERKSEYLKHPVFNTHHSETELLRYIRKLESRDLSLTSSMIPLGSCTMKLNATTEMFPITWPHFSSIHPFAPAEQTKGYQQLIRELEDALKEITGLAGVSLQPNAGSQGEYAGLLVIRAHHEANGKGKRTICLIPQSAHGTNPASAVMAGMEVVVVACDERGNVDLADLRAKASEHKDDLSCLMITYPSTHGVFEESIRDIAAVIHENGGLVYMDGANLNAQVGLTRPGDFGVDVCHLNLHKTFCIPHGGGGPGVGPIAVRDTLVKYLPGNKFFGFGPADSVGAVTSAPWGSASILPISWAYIKMMGKKGLKKASEVAILNANYVAHRLAKHYPILYKGANGFVAHECILDCRNFKRNVGVDVTDIAKRLMDYGFHAPTVSFPVIETLMVEPTESEAKEELDRFCDAMIAIRAEISAVESGKFDKQNNPLKNAPHTASEVSSDKWDRPYSREQAAYPVNSLREFKFWPAVGRIDSAYGDRNLFCSCLPVTGA